MEPPLSKRNSAIRLADLASTQALPHQNMTGFPGIGGHHPHSHHAHLHPGEMGNDPGVALTPFGPEHMVQTNALKLSPSQPVQSHPEAQTAASFTSSQTTVGFPVAHPTQATPPAGTSSSGESSQPLLCMHLATSIVPPPPLITMACSFPQQVLMGTRKVVPIHFSLDCTSKRPQVPTTITTTMPSTGRCVWVYRGTSTAGQSTSATGPSTMDLLLCTATTPWT